MSDVAPHVHRALIAAKKTLAVAESCTGGALTARLVEIPNASLFLLGALVVYSNGWKEQFLHVKNTTLAAHGAVSAETVSEMVQGLLSHTTTDFALAISGELGTAKSRAYIGVAKRGGRVDIRQVAPPSDRLAGIHFTVDAALTALLESL